MLVTIAPHEMQICDAHSSKSMHTRDAYAMERAIHKFIEKFCNGSTEKFGNFTYLYAKVDDDRLQEVMEFVNQLNSLNTYVYRTIINYKQTTIHMESS